MKKIIIGIVSGVVIACLGVFCIIKSLDIDNVKINEEDISIEDSINEEIHFDRVEEKLVDGIEVEINKGYETIDDGYTQEELKKMYENGEYIEDTIYRARCDMDKDGMLDIVEVIIKMEVKYNDMVPNHYNVVGYDGGIEKCIIKINDVEENVEGSLNPISNIEIIEDCGTNKLKFESSYRSSCYIYFIKYNDNKITIYANKYVVVDEDIYYYDNDDLCLKKANISNWQISKVVDTKEKFPGSHEYISSIESGEIFFLKDNYLYFVEVENAAWDYCYVLDLKTGKCNEMPIFSSRSLLKWYEFYNGRIYTVKSGFDVGGCTICSSALDGTNYKIITETALTGDNCEIINNKLYYLNSNRENYEIVNLECYNLDTNEITVLKENISYEEVIDKGIKELLLSLSINE